MNSAKRSYQAIVWRQDREQPGERTTIVAYSLDDAELKLKEQFGENIIYSLYSEEDADKAR